jgi:HD-GYP domain-containing protein (c-di-GMP phosphodiesterase class II)
MPPAGPSGSSAQWIAAREPDLWHYRRTPLYVRQPDGSCRLFKEPGSTLAELGVEAHQLPRGLYLLRADRAGAILEVQQAMMDGLLAEMVQRGDPAEIKTTLGTLLEEALAEPRAEVLAGFSGLVADTVEAMWRRPELVSGFAAVAAGGYSLAAHSVNVMALVLGYCLRQELDRDRAHLYALAGLIHDVGKAGLEPGLITPARRLSEAEFRRLRRHPLRGLELLRELPRSRELLGAVARHHERGDGSGYPQGLTRVEELAQLLGLVDSYEALTDPGRPYRRALEPLEALALLRDESRAGKFGWPVFEGFAYSLA